MPPFAVTTLEDMQFLIQKSLLAVGLGTLAVTIEPEGESVVIDDLVTITRADISAHSLGGSRVFPGWLVAWWKTIPATFHEPEDVERMDLYEGLNPCEAARKAVLFFHEQALENAFEALAFGGDAS